MVFDVTGNGIRPRGAVARGAAVCSRLGLIGFWLDAAGAIGAVQAATSRETGADGAPLHEATLAVR